MSEQGRFFGKLSGAHRHDDGSITVAPMYRDPFQRMLDRERGLGVLTEQHNKFVAKEYASLAAEHRELALRIRDDLKLDPAIFYTFDIKGGDLVLTPVPPAEEADSK